MGISITKSEVLAKDQTADMLIQMFATAGDSLDLNLTFDMDDPKEAKIAKQIEKAETMLADAQATREQAYIDSDDVTVASADSQILALTNMINRSKDSVFGYFVKDAATGTLGHLKGSMLDKIDKALIDLNKRTAWLGGKSVRVIKVDNVNHVVTVARVDKKVKTRQMRPTVESVMIQLSDAFDKVINVEIPVE